MKIQDKYLIEDGSMSGIYHFHLTFKDKTVEDIKVLAKKYKSKVTNIDLLDDSGSVILKDRMLTRYFTSPQDAMAVINEILDEDTSIIRAKIEQVIKNGFNPIFALNFNKPIEDGFTPYLEVHVKVPKDYEYRGKIFKRSRNPVQNTVFLNARIYNEDQFNNYNVEVKNLPIIELQEEISIWDNHPQHDSSWLE